MRFGTYEIGLEHLSLSKRERCLLQLPAGLMLYAKQISRSISEIYGARVFIQGTPVYGSCDVSCGCADSGEIDTIIHVGHPPLGDVNYEDMGPKFIFVTTEIVIDEASISKGVDELEEMMDGNKKLSVVATAQYMHVLGPVKERLEALGHEVPETEPSGRIKKKGLVLGCSFSSVHPDADLVVFVGTGEFHPLGIVMNTGKDVLALNPLGPQVRLFNKVEREHFIRKRYAAVARAGEAEDFGILVSSKPGQNRMKLARSLLKEGEGVKTECDLVLMNEIIPGEVDSLGFEAYVSTACPRIAIDDYFRFKAPVLTPHEFRIAIGVEEFEPSDYGFDEML